MSLKVCLDCRAASARLLKQRSDLRVLLVVAAVVAVSWMVHHWIERPMSGWLRALVAPRKRSSAVDPASAMAANEMEPRTALH